MLSGNVTACHWQWKEYVYHLYKWVLFNGYVELPRAKLWNHVNTFSVGLMSVAVNFGKF
jgi:hypothetical protein